MPRKLVVLGALLLACGLGLALFPARQPEAQTAYSVAKAGLQDVNWGAGTFTRASRLSPGGTVTLNKFTPVNALARGVSGNGVTDDADAIQAILDEFGSVGGGALYLPAGTYILGSYHGKSGAPFGDYQALLVPSSNTMIFGDGPATVLKVKDGLNTTHGFNVFDTRNNASGHLVTRVDSLVFRDFVLDFNGANNAQQTPMTGYNFYNRGISIMRGDNILIENVIFKNNPGTNCVYLGATSPADTATVKSARVINCDFWNVANDTAQTDHSAIYAIGRDIVITGNRVVNPSWSTHGRWAATGIDAHGQNIFIADNLVDNMRIGAFVGSVIEGRNIAFHNNTLHNVAIGVALWQRGSATFTDIALTDNTINVRPNNSNYAFGIHSSYGDNGYQNLTIAGNRIRCVSTAQTSASRGINISANVYRGRIENNYIADFGYPGIKFLPELSSGAPANVINDLHIVENYLVNCGSWAGGGTDYKSGILISESAATLNRIIVRDNTIIDTQAAHVMNNGVCILGNGDSIYVFDNRILGNAGQRVRLDDQSDTWADRVYGPWPAYADTIYEKTPAAGVVIDGLKIRDKTIRYAYNAVNSTTVLTMEHEYVHVSNISANITLTLPAPVANVGKTYHIIKTDGSDTVFVVPAGGVTIAQPSGADTLVSAQDRWSGVAATSTAWLYAGGRANGTPK